MRKYGIILARLSATAVAAYGGIMLSSGRVGQMSAAQAAADPQAGKPAAEAVVAGGPRIDSIACAPRTAGPGSEVAVIDFKGEIGAFFDGDRVYGTLNAVAGNPRIGAIALRINSAGGDSYAAKKHYEALKRLRDACGLPMAAFIGNVGTSGAYWMAMAAGEVHADTLSTVGGVGVLATFMNEREKLDREGVHYSVIRTGERKWPLIPYLPVDNADVQKIRDSLDVVLAEFVAAIEAARQGKLTLTRAQLVTGEAWMGRDAVKLGLVDTAEDIDSYARRILPGGPSAYRIYPLSKEGPRPEKPAVQESTPVAASPTPHG